MFVCESFCDVHVDKGLVAAGDNIYICFFSLARTKRDDDLDVPPRDGKDVCMRTGSDCKEEI